MDLQYSLTIWNYSSEITACLIWDPVHDINSFSFLQTGNHEINILEDPNSSKYPWTKELSPAEWDWLRDKPWTVNLQDRGMVGRI